MRLAVAAGAMSIFSLVAIRLTSLPGGSSGLRPHPGSDDAFETDRFGALEGRIIELINVKRATVGAAPLRVSDQLQRAARSHAKDMAYNRFLALDGTSGDAPSDRVAAAGLEYQEVAENLMIDRGRDLVSLPERTLSAWLASRRSRDNLLAPRFRATALSIVQAADGSLYMTLDLMR